MQTNTQTLIESSLKKGMSYEDYRFLVSNLLEQGKSTGTEQSESLLEYSNLNDRRMKRLDKTIRIPEEAEVLLQNLNKKVTWLVISEGWCGDAAHILPVISKMANLSDSVDLKIVLRDQNDELMKAYLTNGSRSIPKLIMIEDGSGEVIATWGPRPTIATQMVKEYKQEHRMLTPEFKKDLQLWYNKDKGNNTIQDLLKLLALI